MSHPLARTEALLRAAAKLVKKRGLRLEFTWSDLGDLYWVYGVNATAAKFVAMLVRRGRNIP